MKFGEKRKRRKGGENTGREGEKEEEDEVEE